MPKGHAINWTPRELGWIKVNSTKNRREAHAAFCERFRPVSLKAFHGVCKRNGWMTGRDGRFVTGQAKLQGSGAKCSNKTSFKTGHKPATTKQEMELSKHKDGITYIKISDQNWVPYARHLWEQTHGQIPDGQFVSYLDGNPDNLALDNLILKNRREHMLVNTCIRRVSAAKEARPAVTALGKLLAHCD